MSDTELNLTLENHKGIEPFDPEFSTLPGGYHEVLIESFGPHASKSGGTSAKFGLNITSASAKGAGGYIYHGTSMEKEGVRRQWVTVLLSTGRTQEQINGKDKIALTAKTFVGRKAFIFVKEAPEGTVDDLGRKPLPDVKFITPEQYASGLAGSKGNSAAVVTATAKPAAATNAIVKTNGTNAKPPQPASESAAEDVF